MKDLRSLLNTGSIKTSSRRIDLAVDAIDLAEVLAGEDHFAFLDTSSAGGQQGRFSILAWEPNLIFRSKGNHIDIRVNGTWRQQKGNPLDALDDILRACTSDSVLPESLPFAGGAVGYFGYDLFSLIERYELLHAVDDLGLPDCYLTFFDSALIYDHHEEQWHIAGSSVFRETENLDELFDRRIEKVKQLQNLAAEPKHEKRNKPEDVQGDFIESNFTIEEYVAAVRKTIEHIYAGDIYQLNLSQRFHTVINASPFALFKTLRRINPSYYGAFLKYDGHVVVSSSPELFLKRNGKVVETRPIKGTRPRGNDDLEDERLKGELCVSPKESAELSMIVDLERNDLGRVCRYGSVVVDEHRYVETLPTVFHTISTVRGELSDGVGTVDLLRATFPGGSITGCPKIRSIQIIDQLEPTCRNVYTGSIGYVGFNGDLILNIAIRTLIVKGRDVYFQVGGGIVADSNPLAEFTETLHKAAAIMQALKAVEQGDE